MNNLSGMYSVTRSCLKLQKSMFKSEYTVFQVKISSGEEIHCLFGNPAIFTMGHAKFIISNQKEESIYA